MVGPEMHGFAFVELVGRCNICYFIIGKCNIIDGHDWWGLGLVEGRLRM